MDTLSTDDKFRLMADKRSRCYEYGRNIAISVALFFAIVAIILAELAMEDAKDTRALLTSLQTQSQSLQMPQPSSQSLETGGIRALPTSWYLNGKIYNLTSIGNWDKARQECQSHGGDLAVNGMKDYATRLTIARGLSLRRTWVGITDRLQEGRWVWVDGTVGNASDILWNPGQPDNGNAKEHCGELWPGSSNYRMNDESCRTEVQGLCEFDYQQ